MIVKVNIDVIVSFFLNKRVYDSYPHSNYCIESIKAIGRNESKSFKMNNTVFFALLFIVFAAHAEPQMKPEPGTNAPKSRKIIASGYTHLIDFNF